MITVSAKNFDPLGHFEIQPSIQQRDAELRRRVNRYKTLDGGVVMTDRGFTYGDSDLVLKWRSRDSQFENDLRDLFGRQQRCVVSMHPHVYECAFSGIRSDGDETRLELLIYARLDNA